MGLVTIVGLSDLLFLIPQDRGISTQETQDTSLPPAPSATSGEITVPITLPTSTPTTTPQNPNEFKL